MAFSEIEMKKIDNLVGAMRRKRTPAHIKNDLDLIYRLKDKRKSGILPRSGKKES